MIPSVTSIRIPRVCFSLRAGLRPVSSGQGSGLGAAVFARAAALRSHEPSALEAVSLFKHESPADDGEAHDRKRL